ncbi:MAG: hypothetical protein AMK69_18020 [Nitrospira bacterium SG8_3]|nr:MAG: hypothetical protein AMK69_18020 [Nitrospira bacterium SG8_3]
MRIEAGLRESTPFALDTKRQSERKGTIMGEHRLFLNGYSYFLAPVGVSGLNENRTVITFESLLKLLW